MEQVDYRDWLKSFNALAKEYLESIDWENIVFEDDDFGVVGDDLQNTAYVNVHLDKFGDSEYDLSSWENYDASCSDRTDFQIDLKNQWEVVSEQREYEA